MEKQQIKEKVIGSSNNVCTMRQVHNYDGSRRLEANKIVRSGKCTINYYLDLKKMLIWGMQGLQGNSVQNV